MSPREAALVRTFVELTDTLVDHFDVVELLTVLTGRCVEVLDVTAAGLMLASDTGELRVVASSSDAMRLLELFEVQAEEGPCMECYHSGDAIKHPQLSSSNTRWPRFTPRALAAGFESVHALPMRFRGQTIGALNLFRDKEGSLDEADPRGRSSVRRCRNDRHPAIPRGCRVAGRERTTQQRTQQPRRHRASQRDGGRAVGPRHGAGIPPFAQLRPRSQPATRRRRPQRDRRHGQPGIARAHTSRSDEVNRRRRDRNGVAPDPGDQGSLAEAR